MDIDEVRGAALSAVRMPDLLDDECVEARRAALTALAADPAVAHIVLDAVDLREVSARGLGLLAAIRLLAGRRGAGVCVIRCGAELVTAFSLVRLRICDAHGPDLSVHASCAGAPDDDWTPPWWTGAASNA